MANAPAAGAIAVIIFNKGQPGRDRALRRRSRSEPGRRVRSVGIIRTPRASTVAELAAAGPVTARVETQTLSETRTTRNVIAETPGGRADNVVMAGAHLDSVTDGPGHQRQRHRLGRRCWSSACKLADERVKNKVRLAFWGGEECGLLGSTYYVDAADRSSSSSTSRCT